MRMRKKANLEPRMEACAAWQVKDPVAMKGSWRSLYPQARALWVEIGCGKGKFTVETAQANPDILLIAIERCRDKRIESLYSTHTQKVENWLDSQEVCLLLGVSKRTLQYYRSSGRLAYSQIGSKIYYKTSDIERIIADSETQNQSPKHPTSYEKN